jgi:hypothetical protein
VRSVAVLGAVVGALIGAGNAVAAGWVADQLPVPEAPQGQLYDVSCSSSSDCIAVGSTRTQAGAVVPLAESWNGTSWTRQSIPAPSGVGESELLGVSCSPGSTTFCVAVGYTGLTGAALIEQWDGSSWSIADSPVISGSYYTQLSDVSCASASSCMAVGFAGTPPGSYYALVEHWDGSSWAVQSFPTGSSPAELAGVSCTSLGCVAVGLASSGGNSQTGDIAAESVGGVWTLGSAQTPADQLRGGLSGVSCAPGTLSCTAVGSYQTLSGTFTLAETGTAAVLTTESTANLPYPSTDSELNRVSCSAANACTAVGVGNTRSQTLVERWDGSSWSIQNSPSPPGDYEGLMGVSCPGANSCTAVGGGPGYGTEGATVAESWDGTSWTVQRTPDTEPLPVRLSASSCANDTSCMGVGWFTDFTGNDVPVAERWDGAGWTLMEPPPGTASPTHIAGVSCPSSTSCMAVGTQGQPATPFAEKWDGNGWSVVSPAAPDGSWPSTLTSVSCPSSDDCTAIGSVQDRATAVPPLIEHWDGSAWASEPDPGVTGGSLVSVACPAADNCTAVGDISTGGGPAVPGAQHWDGSTWTDEPMAAPPNTVLQAVSCPGVDTCFAVGEARDDGSGQITSVAERRSGSAWTQVPTQNPGGDVDELLGVSCATSSLCAAVGASATPTTTEATLAEQWDGAAWTTTPTPNPGGLPSFLTGVSCPTTVGCIAVGYGENGLTPVALRYSAPPQRALSISLGGTGSGVVNGAGVSCPGTCSATYTQGAQVTLTATPATGSRFAGWSGGGCSGTSTCTMTMSSDQSVTATFTAIPPGRHSLAVSKAGSGSGTVTSSPAGISCGAACATTFPAASQVTLTATPSAGSAFAGWSGGDCTGQGKCIVTLSTDETVTAAFRRSGARRPPVLSRLHASPQTFTLNGRRVNGRCVKANRTNAHDRPCVRHIKLTIGYRLNISASVKVMVARALSGRTVHGRCVRPTHKNHSHHACTRLSPLRGSLTENGQPGNNDLVFSGRIGAYKLSSGSYRLTARPIANGQAGASMTIALNITS